MSVVGNGDWGIIGAGYGEYMEATMIDEDGNWLDLACPKCGCLKINCDKPDLGVPAKCYECGHKFTITGNCWKLNPEMSR